MSESRFYTFYSNNKTVFYIIFTAHSHTLRNINDWTIQLGITRRHSHSYYGEKVKISRVIPHPQYNSEIIHDNDIALFQVSERFFVQYEKLKAIKFLNISIKIITLKYQSLTCV